MRTIVYLIFAVIPLAWVQPARAGFDAGNAGDIYASEFILTGRDLVQRLDRLFQKNTQAYDTTPLRNVIETTKIDTSEHVFLGDSEKDAVNHPSEKRIELSRSRWRDYRNPTKTHDRLKLVLHEYLFMTGVDDTNFPVSQHLIELLNVGNYSPGTWWNPVNPVNFVMPTLDYLPDGCTIAPMNLNLKNSNETVVLEAMGDCKEAYRKVKIVKSAGVIPPSSNAQGLFHRFDIYVYDRAGKLLGSIRYTPPWNIGPIQSPDGTYSSGEISPGDASGVEIEFRYLNQ